MVVDLRAHGQDKNDRWATKHDKWASSKLYSMKYVSCQHAVAIAKGVGALYFPAELKSYLSQQKPVQSPRQPVPKHIRLVNGGTLVVQLQ